MKIFSWIIRCALVHVALYAVIALPFGLIIAQLSSSQTVVLRFFEMFIVPHPGHMAGQLLRGIILALVLLPFYSMFFTHPKGRIVLFWAVWGVSMISSVEPLPGSIEGWIYTLTTPLEHALILAVTLLQALAFTFILSKVEASFGRKEDQTKAAGGLNLENLSLVPRFGGVLRFMLLHVATYLAAGLTFMIMQDYESAFEASRFFAMYRPLDGPIVGNFAVPLQIPRGILLGLWMAPFIAVAKKSRYGWLLLFSAMFGLTALATAGFLPLIFTHIAEGGSLINYILIGTPEIFVQMLIFSALVMLWENKLEKRQKNKLENK